MCIRDRRTTSFRGPGPAAGGRSTDRPSGGTVLGRARAAVPRLEAGAAGAEDVRVAPAVRRTCLLYTSDAADDM
eukprot:4793911-Alexandrium_andersonii.AAC.1